MLGATQASAESAKRLFQEAQQYLESGQQEFAFLKFEKILKNFAQSEYAEEAQLYLIEYLHRQNSIESTLKEIEKYLSLFPAGENLQKVKTIKNAILTKRIAQEAATARSKGNWDVCVKKYKLLLKRDEANLEYEEALIECEDQWAKSAESKKMVSVDQLRSQLANNLGKSVEQIQEEYESFWK